MGDGLQALAGQIAAALTEPLTPEEAHPTAPRQSWATDTYTGTPREISDLFLPQRLDHRRSHRPAHPGGRGRDGAGQRPARRFCGGQTAPHDGAGHRGEDRGQRGYGRVPAHLYARPDRRRPGCAGGQHQAGGLVLQPIHLGARGHRQRPGGPGHRSEHRRPLSLPLLSGQRHHWPGLWPHHDEHWRCTPRPGGPV